MVEGKAPAKKAPRKRTARKPEPTPVEETTEVTPGRVMTSVESAPVQPNVDHCGYVGETTDPEPDDTYTLSGVLGL